MHQSMGFCPQYNVLFDMLTVREHIMFYGQLKGLSRDEAHAEMIQMLTAVGLLAKADSLTKHLSGKSSRNPGKKAL